MQRENFLSLHRQPGTSSVESRPTKLRKRTLHAGDDFQEIVSSTKENNFDGQKIKIFEFTQI